MHGNDLAGFKIGRMPFEDERKQVDSLCRRNIGEPDQTGVGGRLGEYKSTEILVHRNKNSSVRLGLGQNGSVSGVGYALAQLGHIMPPRPKPFSQTAADAPVDQESHPDAMRTASIRSSATMACA